MKGPLPIFLVILGLAVISFGFMQRHRLESDLARHDTSLAVPGERAFTHYFIIGGLLTVAGVVVLAARGRS